MNAYTQKLSTLIVNNDITANRIWFSITSNCHKMNCFGKNVIITGGTGGIGMAVVREMLKHGAKVLMVLMYRRSTKFSAFLHSIQAIGILDIADSQLIQTLQSDFPQQTIAFLKTDVRKRKQLNLAFEEFISNFDYVDIVVSGAGIINEGDPDDTVLINLVSHCGQNHFRSHQLRILTICIQLGVINTTYEAIDHMSVNGSGRGGIIANISSLAGIGYFHASPVYCGTKFGVVGFSKSVAVRFMWPKRHSLFN